MSFKIISTHVFIVESFFNPKRRIYFFPFAVNERKLTHICDDDDVFFLPVSIVNDIHFYKKAFAWQSFIKCLGVVSFQSLTSKVMQLLGRHHMSGTYPMLTTLHKLINSDGFTESGLSYLSVLKSCKKKRNYLMMSWSK